MRKMENALRARVFEIETSCLVQCCFMNQRRSPPSFSKIRTFFIFLILRIFLSLSHKSGPHYEKNETCPDFAQTWWGPSLVHKTTLYQTGSLYLKNPGSESILHFSPFLHFSISQISISQISKKLRKMKNIRILLKLGGDLL